MVFYFVARDLSPNRETTWRNSNLEIRSSKDKQWFGVIWKWKLQHMKLKQELSEIESWCNSKKICGGKNTIYHQQHHLKPVLHHYDDDRNHHHHHHNHRKSVIGGENCCPMTQNDHVLSSNPRYLKRPLFRIIKIRFLNYHHMERSSWSIRAFSSMHSFITIFTIIIIITIMIIIHIIITVRSLYLMARQQKSRAVSPARAVTFVLQKFQKLTSHFSWNFFES